MEDYCGLPEIEPLPDVDVLESLRLAANRTHRPSTVSTLTESIAGFEGPNIGNMCADIMRGRWLWIGELLVHDLGQFRCAVVALQTHATGVAAATATAAADSVPMLPCSSRLDLPSAGKLQWLCSSSIQHAAHSGQGVAAALLTAVDASAPINGRKPYT